MFSVCLFAVIDFTYYGCGWVVYYSDCLLLVIVIVDFACRCCLLSLNLLLIFD